MVNQVSDEINVTSSVFLSGVDTNAVMAFAKVFPCDRAPLQKKTLCISPFCHYKKETLKPRTICKVKEFNAQYI